VHKAPLALSEQFWLRVTGKQPDKFGDPVLPTVDVGQHYLAGNLQSVSGAYTAMTWNGTLGSAIVTITEPCWLHSLTVELESAADWVSGWLRAQLSWQGRDATDLVRLQDTNQFFGSTAFPSTPLPVVIAWQPPVPWLLAPGTIFRAQYEGDFTGDPGGGATVKALVSNPALNV